MTVLRRREDGKATVFCDPCLAPLVRALNDGGLPTVWSCCGHGRLPALIGLSDGRQLIITDFEEAHRVLGTCWPGVTIND